MILNIIIGILIGLAGGFGVAKVLEKSNVSNLIKNAKKEAALLKATLEKFNRENDLEEGDVIPVDIPSTMVLRANGVPVFKTRMGTSRGNLALEIIKRTDINQMDSF